MVGLKGHRSVGGFRASIYNAVEPAWVEALAGLLDDFARRNG
jgi:phosphoserine aminotransferase